MVLTSVSVCTTLTRDSAHCSSDSDIVVQTSVALRNPVCRCVLQVQRADRLSGCRQGRPLLDQLQIGPVYHHRVGVAPPAAGHHRQNGQLAADLSPDESRYVG